MTSGPALASRRRAFASDLLAIGSIAALCACARSTTDQVELKPGSTVERVADSAFEAVLDVPQGTSCVRFDLSVRGLDMRLFARRGERVDETDFTDATVTTVDGRASLILDRFTEPCVTAGRWYLRIEEDPHSPGITPGIEPTLALATRVFATATHAVLEAGRRSTTSIPEHDSGGRTFRIDVPSGARALRVDVLDTDADVDLFAGYGAPLTQVSDDTPAAEHTYGRETLVIDDPAVGAWFVDVAAPWDDERVVTFTLLATFDADPPADLAVVPALPPLSSQSIPELAEALSAVVEITTEDGTGSGVFVGSRGWILTNAHVVEGKPGEAASDIVISASKEPNRPPVEWFRALVERFDSARDLALLRVTSGFHGQPIPDGYRFPTLSLGNATRVTIGAPLWLVGYPTTGGEGSRVTIHATRGVVSGFERGAFGDLVKTDAEITSGNSGGAAVDATGRLIGLPTSTIESGAGQSGMIHPIEWMPEAWRALLEEGR